MPLIHLLPILADQADDNAAGALVAAFGLFGLVLACGSLLIGFGILAFICWFLSGCLKALPPEHRKQQPNMVWLLFIPLFSIVWNFFVFPAIADSYKSYFNAIGRTDVGDCGKGLALAFCIICCCFIIPYLNICASFAALIVLIIVLIKFAALKKMVANPAAGFQIKPT